MQLTIKTPKLPQKVRSSIKTKDTFYCCEELHLRFDIVPRFVSAELHCHKIALVFTTNKPTRKTRYRGRLY